MANETTGLSLTEWLLMIFLTAFFVGWAYFDHHVIRTQNFGDVDAILFSAMMVPAVFFSIKIGEIVLRAKSAHLLSNHSSNSIMQLDPQKGSEIGAVVRGRTIAVPKTRSVRYGISKPTLPAVSRVRYLFAPEAYIMKFYGSLICMADVSKFQGEQHNELVIDIRNKINSLPGVRLDVDDILFGDLLETSWARKQTVNVGNTVRERYVIPSIPTKYYNLQQDRTRNAEYVMQLELIAKARWAVGNLKGSTGGI